MVERLHIHDVLVGSKVNGPGVRNVVWVQGCDLGCPECFNPATHARPGGVGTPVEEVLERLTERVDGLEGVTISGGEPFQQAEAVLELCARIKAGTDLSVVCLSGYTLAELKMHPGWRPDAIDVLIAGRYRARERVARGLAGSANKEFHFFSDRYRREDFEGLPEAEVWIDAAGGIRLSGIEPLRF